MREYVLSIATMAVICSLSDIIIPKSWQRYVGLLTGALLLLTLIAPLAKFRGLEIRLPDTPDFPITDFNTKNSIKERLEERISVDIQERISTEFKIKTNPRVTVNTDEDGAIAGVAEISLDIKSSPAVSARLCEIYAPEKITWRS